MRTPMGLAFGFLSSTLVWLPYAESQQPDSGPCGGSTQLFACVFLAEDPVGGGHFTLVIEERHGGRPSLRVRVPGAVARAEQVLAWRDKAVALLGVTRSGGHVIALVHPTTGFLELRYSDSDAASVGDAGRSLSFTQAFAKVTLDLDDPQLFERGDPSGGQARLLRYGTLGEKWRVLWLVADGALQDDPRIREALVAEALRLAGEEAQPVSRRASAGTESNLLAYREMLLSRAAFISADERLLPVLVRSSLVATRHSVLVSFGQAGIPLIHDALRKPTPPGHSAEYRPGLMRALTEITRGSFGALSPRAEQELIAAVREAFAKPSDWRVLREAIRLAEFLDVPAIVADLERFAGASDLQTLGVPPGEAAAEIRTAAADILSRRMTAR